MYNLLAQHEGAVHHISYHPSFPYSNCIFYQANTTENSARATFYNIPGTPRVVLNGTLVAGGVTLLPAGTLNAALNQTSPVYVQVTETATTVTVRVHTLGEKPAGDFKLYAAMSEKIVNYNAPNGESVHRDVFRDMLSDINGQAITLAETGGSVEFQFNKTSNPNWVAGELFVTAWVQNTQSNEVLNSGTRFDPVVSSVSNLAVQPLSIQPNPATDVVYLSVRDDAPRSVEVFALNGALIASDYTIGNGQVQLEVGALEAGIYFVKVQGEKGTFTGKFVKY
jgi:hypothetical protein